MKKISIVLFLLMLLMGSSAQSFVEYSYDNAGNRIKRETTTIQLLSAHLNDTTDQTPEILKEEWGERVIKIYPNPTFGNAQIEILGGDAEASYRMNVFSSDGSHILMIKCEPNNKSLIGLASYPAGTYVLIISSGEESIPFKIIKQ